jgi:hypothetical protein
MTTSFSKRALSAVAAIAVSMALTPLADAAGGGGRGGGGGGAKAAPQASGGGARAGGGGGSSRQAAQVNNSKADTRTNNVRNTSVNNTNVNVNRNVNVNVEGGGCCNNGWDNDYHPVATAAAVTATVALTSAIVGSIVNAPPPGCVPVNVGGMVYQQCGTTWYQPQGAQYVVVNPPY